MTNQQIIDNLVKFEYYCGGYFEKFDCIEIIVNNDLSITINTITTYNQLSKKEPLNNVTMPKDDFEKFKKKLSKYIKNWKNSYSNNKILDGTQWSVDITGLDGTLHYGGNNEYPFNWTLFKMYMNKLMKKYVN